MDKRDPKTKFQHQKNLHDARPEITPTLVRRLHATGRVVEAKSYNVIAKETEMLLVISGVNGDPVALKLNPDIVLNLGINLLKNGSALGWFDVSLENIDPPQPH